MKWDPIDGQLRYIDAPELVSLFGASETGARPHRMAHRACDIRFGDTIDVAEKRHGCLIPEISYHEPNNSDVFARSISQAKDNGSAWRLNGVVWCRCPKTMEYRELASSPPGPICGRASQSRQDHPHFGDKREGVGKPL